MGPTLKWHGLLMLVAAATMAHVAGCAEDGLSESFEPGDPDQNLGDLGPLYPLRAGDTLWYTFFRTWRPSTTGDPVTGYLVGEKQASGDLCLRIREVRDTALHAFEAADQTLVVADTRVTGGYGSDEISIADQEAADNPSPTIVDEALSELWLSELLFPSVDHGLETAVSRQYTTRVGPHPPNLAIATLPFFEPRISRDHAWGGFDWSDPDCANLADEVACEDALCIWSSSAGQCGNRATNVVGDMREYLIESGGCTSLAGGDGQCRESHAANQMCSMQAEEQLCTPPQCFWNDAEATCVSMSKLELLWRDNVDAGTGLRGDVLRRIVITYQPNGILRSWSEMVVPDPDPAGPLPSTSTLDQCTGKCMTGELLLGAGPIENANCNF